MKSTTFYRAVLYVSRLGLAGVFGLSAVAKLTDIPGFAEQIGRFGVVSDVVVVPTAWGLIGIEILLAGALAANFRGSLVAAATLLIIFTTVLSYGVFIGLDISCGCFGAAFQVPLKVQIVLDLALAGACGLIDWSQKACGIKTVGPSTVWQRIGRSVQSSTRVPARDPERPSSGASP